MELLTAALVIVTAYYAMVTAGLARSAAESTKLTRSQILLSRQPTVLMRHRAKLMPADALSRDTATIQSVHLSCTIRGEHPALSLRMEFELSNPRAITRRHQQDSGFHQGATYWPEERDYGAIFLIDSHPGLAMIEGPIEGEVTLAWRDAFGGLWSSLWRVIFPDDVDVSSRTGEVELLAVQSPYL